MILNFKQVRNLGNLTQQELSEKWNVSQAFISKIEKEQITPELYIDYYTKLLELLPNDIKVLVVYQNDKEGEKWQKEKK